MKIPCSKCGRLFEVEYITQLINLCDSCKIEDAKPDFFSEIFGK